MILLVTLRDATTTYCHFTARAISLLYFAASASGGKHSCNVLQHAFLQNVWCANVACICKRQNLTVACT